MKQNEEHRVLETQGIFRKTVVNSGVVSHLYDEDWTFNVY